MMKLDEILVTRNWVGKPVRRKEDIRLVKGEAAYVDDLNMDCYQAAILRSPYAHARISRIDLTKAAALKGVVAVLTGQGVARETKPISARAITRPATQYVMAADKVRYVGEPVAAVVAEDRYIAEDALDLIEVEYEPLKPVVTIEDALKPDAPLVFEEAGSNVLMHDKMQHGDIEQAYREADLVLKENFKVHRYSSTPLEPWAIIANYERASDSFVVWSNDQQHGRSLTNVCNTLDIPIHKLRLIVPDSGGGFGIKLALWPYIVILSLLAKKLGLDPVEIRLKNFVQPQQMPYTTPSGEIYESGDYPQCLKKALDLIGYEELKGHREEGRKKGKYIGIGISAGVEPGTSNLGYYYTARGTPEYTGNAEGAIVGIDYDGNVNVLLGSVDSGQGHATTTAQVVADMLGINPDRGSMNAHVDSLIPPFFGHSGVFSNKFNDVGLAALFVATKKIRDKMLRIASHALGVPERELVLHLISYLF